jgi:hypothetical protein
MDMPSRLLILPVFKKKDLFSTMSFLVRIDESHGFYFPVFSKKSLRCVFSSSVKICYGIHSGEACKFGIDLQIKMD